MASRVAQRFDFEVREPFACERENAQAACLPLRPMTLRFNAPVTRGIAARIRLEGPGDARRPPHRQRVRLAATGAHDDGLRWHIDGRLHTRGAGLREGDGDPAPGPRRPTLARR